MPTPTRRVWMDAWERDLTASPAARRSAARVDAQLRSRRYYSREATARVPEPVRERQVEVRPAPPSLKVVSRRKPHWGMVLLTVVFAGILLGAAVIAPVLINSSATGLETQVGQLEDQATALTADKAALSAQISALSSPERVSEQALRLGLVPAHSIRYVELAAGTAVMEGDTTLAGR